MTADDDKIAAVLDGTYCDPDTGRPVAVGTRALTIARSLIGAEGELVRRLGLGPKLAVVSDATTHAVLGRRVERALGDAAIAVVLPGSPHPDAQTVEAVRAATASADALVAVGSGTINDLAKYAATLDGKPYAVFGTAPSMNGYTSESAAITVGGHKLSLPAKAPVGAFFDLAVMAAAPRRLIRAGLGDSLCRSTAEADWLLAHLLHGTPFRAVPFVLLADDEPVLFEMADALVAGDLEVMERLVRTLVLSGFGTAIVGNSQPASQGEHLISHYLDMFAPPDRPLVFHGEQVGVTTLSSARLQEAMLAGPAPVVEPDTATEAEFRERYGDELGGSCWADFSRKRLDAAGAEALNAKLSHDWDAIRGRIEAARVPAKRLTEVLRAAGSDLTPEAIHLDRDFYETAMRRGREIRNRYTFLDLAANAGRLEALLTTL